MFSRHAVSKFLMWVILISLSGLPGVRAANPQWNIQRWSTEGGLPDNGVRAIAQTPDGYLWLGTLNGLARFDGVRFAVYTHGNTPGLVSEAVNALAVDAAGTLWIATPSGLVEWRDGVIKRWTEEDGLPGKTIYSVVVGPAGVVWWREGSSCGWLKEGRGARYGVEHGLATNQVWSITRSRDGGLIALTHLGVQRLDMERERFTKVVPWPTSAAEWQGYEDSSGRFWAAGSTGAFRLESNQWVSLPATNGFGRGAKVYEDRAGRAWVFSGAAGLRQLETDDTTFPPVLQPEGRSVSTVFEDREGNLWTGTGDGLFRLRPQRIRAWTTRDGLPSNKVRSVSAGPDGSVWAGTESGLARLRLGRVESFGELGDRPDFGSWPIWADRQGVVWGHRWGQGLLRFDGRRFELRLPQAVTCLGEDRAGRLCVGTGRGVSRWRDGGFENLFGSNVFRRSVLTMCQDRAGSWWLGTKDEGVKRFDAGATNQPSAVFTFANGLSDDTVMAIHEDIEGVIWIGTANGLSRFKDGRLAVVGLRHGLVEGTINQILEDDFRNLWLSGLRGIHRVSRAQLNAVADGRTNCVPCFTYGEADGMASGETNGEMQPAGCKTPDGHLWFPTIKGVVEIDPRVLVESEVAPTVVIEQVKAEGKEVFRVSGSEVRVGGARTNTKHETWNPELQLGPGKGRVLEIRYTANSLSVPEKVRFKWKLEPRDTDWHDAGAQRFVFLQNLRPGSYTFRVQACNQHGLWNEAGAGLAFVIAPQFHETWMFYAAGAAGILAAVAAFTAVRLRWQRRLLTARHGQAMSEERARIARDLHDDLGTALTGVALEIDLARREAQNEVAAKLAGSAARVRSLAERMREAVWAVNPQCDTVSSLASFLEQQAGALLNGGGVRGRFEFPEDIPPLPLDAETRHQLALGVREALTNAQRHAHATEVVLGLALRGDALIVSVRDNGRGFDAGAIRSEPGHGLHNLRARLARVGGELAVTSRPGDGTRVEMRVLLVRPVQRGGLG